MVAVAARVATLVPVGGWQPLKKAGRVLFGGVFLKLQGLKDKKYPKRAFSTTNDALQCE